MKKHAIFVFGLVVAGLVVAPAQADPARDGILSGFAAATKAANPAFSGFSAKRGESLFRTKHVGGKPKTPTCTSCHTKSPSSTGQTRAGKPIEPMAVSKTPTRFTDPKKVAKWFRRNCKSVLGRECTSLEKGDFITYMLGQ